MTKFSYHHAGYDPTINQHPPQAVGFTPFIMLGLLILIGCMGVMFFAGSQMSRSASAAQPVVNTSAKTFRSAILTPTFTPETTDEPGVTFIWTATASDTAQPSGTRKVGFVVSTSIIQEQPLPMSPTFVTPSRNVTVSTSSPANVTQPTPIIIYQTPRASAAPTSVQLPTPTNRPIEPLPADADMPVFPTEVYEDAF